MGLQEYRSKKRSYPIIRALSSLVDIAGTNSTEVLNQSSDLKNLKGDWNAVGKDIKKGIITVGSVRTTE